jgi:hypothetical protein
LTAATAFCSSAANPANTDAAKNTGGQSITTQQNGNNTTATRSIGGNKNKTNWSKIKDMFM